MANSLSPDFITASFDFIAAVLALSISSGKIPKNSSTGLTDSTIESKAFFIVSMALPTNGTFSPNLVTALVISSQ